MAFHIKNPDVERNLRRLADSYGVGLTEMVGKLVAEEIKRMATRLPLAERCVPIRRDIGLADYAPLRAEPPAEADPHFYKFAPGAVLADVLLGEDAGAYAAEIDAARETCTAPHAIQRASEILIDVAGVSGEAALHGIEALVKLAGMKVIHPRAVHQTTVLRLRAAFAAERRNVLPPNDQIWDEAYRLHFRVKVAMMGHHKKFPTLGVQ